MTLKEMKNKGQLHELICYVSIHSSPIRWVKIQKVGQHTLLVKLLGKKHFQMLIARLQNESSRRERHLAISSKDTYKFTLSPGNPTSWNLSQIQCQNYVKDMQNIYIHTSICIYIILFSCTTAVEKYPLEQEERETHQLLPLLSCFPHVPLIGQPSQKPVCKGP